MIMLGWDTSSLAMQQEVVRQFMREGAKAPNIRIRAFVTPYGVANSYNETITPRAWKNQLPAAVPLGLGHERPAGLWTKLWEDTCGLWAEGELFIKPNSGFDKDKFKADFPGLSVTYVASTANRQSRMIGVDPVLGKFKFKPAYVTARDFAATLANQQATVAEISLVSDPAFPDTHWEYL